MRCCAISPLFSVGLPLRVRLKHAIRKATGKATGLASVRVIFFRSLVTTPSRLPSLCSSSCHRLAWSFGLSRLQKKKRPSEIKKTDKLFFPSVGDDAFHLYPSAAIVSLGRLVFLGFQKKKKKRSGRIKKIQKLFFPIVVTRAFHLSVHPLVVISLGRLVSLGCKKKKKKDPAGWRSPETISRTPTTSVWRRRTPCSVVSCPGCRYLLLL